ncbi:ribosome recycling factor [bacterium]|nr:ribosome recycling factor [bacterium]
MPQLSETKKLFTQAVDHLAAELSTLRTGRATPAILDHVQVEAYGTYQPIKALASLSTPDSKTLQIDPWDNSVVKAIESAIVASDIGIMPIVDGKTIRLVMPMMTEENRKRLVKVASEKLEDARVAVRRIREEVRKDIAKQTGVGEDAIRKEQEESISNTSVA